MVNKLKLLTKSVNCVAMGCLGGVENKTAVRLTMIQLKMARERPSVQRI